MSYFGKRLRLGRLTPGAHRTGLIVPIDHGLTLGPVPGLESISTCHRWITHPAVTGVIAHKGVIERLGNLELLENIAVVVHVNGMSGLSPRPDDKERLTSVESAVRLGADAVSIQINFDGENDAQNLIALGELVDEAQKLAIPVLTMVYDKVACEDPGVAMARLRHLMRICVELGSDAIKVGAPEPPEHLAELLHGVVEHTPVFVAGGARCEDERVLELARVARHWGARGLCMGRNVFQRKDPGPLLTAVARVLATQACGSTGSPTVVGEDSKTEARERRVQHDAATM
ncbi:MAG: aldolase [Myxococcales bacterium]|nr:aldolase [Myxococcales bacterium]MDD9967049.1 aldolase [Myxococcales bacterium]